MSTSNLDAIVQPAADKLSQQEVDLARDELDLQLQDSPWNMNQRLNMIAYEDQV